MDPSVIQIVVGVVSGAFGAGVTYGLLQGQVKELQRDCEAVNKQLHDDRANARSSAIAMELWRESRINKESDTAARLAAVEKTLERIAAKLGVMA